MFERIIIATDGSALSRKAVRHGIGLAAATDAELVALTVVPHYPVTFLGGLTLSPREMAGIEKRWAKEGQAVVDKVRDAAQAQGVAAKAVVSRSNLVAEAIMAAAKKYKCDLVVMASHGRKGIKRVLLGSETQQVLTHSSVPVLVVR
jgi:nucleotide-binding universal stress UspA family protein